MARVLFDLMFVLALIVPVVAVFVGAIALLLQPRPKLTMLRSLRAHA